jgi:hypothetical protein
MDFDVMNATQRKRKNATEIEKNVVLRAGSKTNILSFSTTLLDSTTKAKKVVAIESGGERLKRAHTLLVKAQMETKDILTPILLRMERAKKIKTADLALQSIVALLCFPHSMRVALKKGDYEDVLSISRKIQLMSPGNVLSSAKVLLQVQKTSASIVGELKNKCIDVLLGTEIEKEEKEKEEESNGNNHENDNLENDEFTEIKIVQHIPSIPELYRHVHLLLEIEGEEKQKQNLKICFYKKLTKFGEEIRKYRKRYFFDSNNAVFEGQKYFREKNEENNYGRKDSKNSINLEKENGFFHGNRGSNSSHDLHGNDAKRRGSNFTGSDVRVLNGGHGDGPSPDWLPSDTTREEKIILKSILDGRHSKNKGKENEKEMGNNVKEKKNKNGDNDESEGQRKLKLFSDFGLSEIEINEEEEEDEEEEEENENDNMDNNSNNNMDRKRFAEKESKVKFQDQPLLQSNAQSAQKIKKFQLFESVDEEENVRKNDQKKAEKDRENNNRKNGGDMYILGENPENYYCDLFCARVRLLYVLRVARTVDAWTPVLAQYVLFVNDYYSHTSFLFICFYLHRFLSVYFFIFVCLWDIYLAFLSSSSTY